MRVDPVTLEVIRNGLRAIAEEMNAALIRTGYSPNIKEREDCSSAIFNSAGQMLAQAESIPVHLGAMPYSVAAAVDAFPPESLDPGDAILVNDPYRGGAHLPDVTLISPIHVHGNLIGFAANRAHHADVGGSHPGSVAATANEVYEEGIRVPPVRLYRNGTLNKDVLSLFLSNVRASHERRGDLRAQHAANETGIDRFKELVQKHGQETVADTSEALLDYAERRMNSAISEVPNGQYSFSDVIEDDGHGREDLPITVLVSVENEAISVDFAGSATQSRGAINAVEAVTVSATYYALRCLTDPTIPPNAGCYRPISVHAPKGTIVNAEPPAAVVGGNLETSQRIVDVVLGAMAAAVPDRAVAASQGTMNNLTIGGINPETGREYALYETQAGGAGASAAGPGQHAVQVHMTNTKNTPIEVIESSYPLTVRYYGIRPETGGEGQHRGGSGIRRDLQLRSGEATMSILSERRRTRPYGIAGGEAGSCGEDILIVDGEDKHIPPKSVHQITEGTIISIRTPGGGGYGKPEHPASDS